MDREFNYPVAVLVPWEVVIHFETSSLLKTSHPAEFSVNDGGGQLIMWDLKDS